MINPSPHLNMSLKVKKPSRLWYKRYIFTSVLSCCVIYVSFPLYVFILLSKSRRRVWDRKRVCACVHAHASLFLHLFRLSVTHEAWCLGLPAACVSSSAEVLTVGLKSEWGRRRRAKGTVRPRCGKTGKAQTKKWEKTDTANHFVTKGWIIIIFLKTHHLQARKYQMSVCSVIRHMWSLNSICICIRKTQRKQRGLLTNISMSRMENDKHSSWLLNRSDEAVCGLQGMRTFQCREMV